MIERMHGERLEHCHEGYDYWHPASRVHNESTPEELPVGHILAKVAPDEPRGLQVQLFNWASWDKACEAKGICQGYESIRVIATDCATHDRGQPCPDGQKKIGFACTQANHVRKMSCIIVM
jgi:hypothetical protein